jgi:hypothetical protein
MPLQSRQPAGMRRMTKPDSLIRENTDTCCAPFTATTDQSADSAAFGSRLQHSEKIHALAWKK